MTNRKSVQSVIIRDTKWRIRVISAIRHNLWQKVIRVTQLPSACLSGRQGRSVQSAIIRGKKFPYLHRMKQIIIICILALSIATAQAQDTNPFRFSFNHVALSVNNVDSSANFYKTVLGLTEITNRTQKPGIRWMSLGGDKELHLVSTIKAPVTINKAVHIALTTPDFLGFVRRLEQNRLPYSNWEGAPQKITTRADGILQLYFQDPDGYWIEVNSVAAQ
jgi:lactoylglutathione lyase